MELIEQVVPPTPGFIIKTGRSSFEVGSNDNLKIKAGNDTILDGKVPAGKVWKVSLQVRIEEKDA